ALAAIGNPSLTYVEGYITVHGVPIKHAWTVDEDGQVVDSTIDGAGKVDNYFGVPFSTTYLEKTLVKNKVYGLLDFNSLKTLKPLLRGDEKEFSPPETATGPLATPA